MPEVEEVAAAPARGSVDAKVEAMKRAMEADNAKMEVVAAKPKGKAVPGRYDEEGYSLPSTLQNCKVDENGYTIFDSDDEFNEENDEEHVDPRWEYSMEELRESYRQVPPHRTAQRARTAPRTQRTRKHHPHDRMSLVHRSFARHSIHTTSQPPSVAPARAGPRPRARSERG